MLLVPGRVDFADIGEYHVSVFQLVNSIMHETEVLSVHLELDLNTSGVFMFQSKLPAAPVLSHEK